MDENVIEEGNNLSNVHLPSSDDEADGGTEDGETDTVVGKDDWGLD